MWNIFAKENGFSYEVGERGRPVDFSFYSLHDATHKTRGGNYSIFRIVTNSVQKSQYSNSNLRRLKTLKHPNVLSFVYHSEDDPNVEYLVTEQAIPLLEYLGKMDGFVWKNEYVAWGIMKIVKALIFCHDSAKLFHNNVGSNSVFVDRAGEWKLAEFGASDEAYSGPVAGTRAEQYHSWVKNNSKVTWELDTYGVAVLVLEAFEGRIHTDRSIPVPSGKVPKPLRNAINIIFAGENIPNLQQFLENGIATEGFQNDFIENITFLEEIHLKSPEERSRFYKNFQDYLRHLPGDIQKFKIFPSLMLSYDYGCEGSELLPSVLEFCETIDPDVDLVPMITRLYHSKSRKTRKALLENMSRYVQVLAPSVLNDTIYPMWEVGFQDTCELIRADTLKSTVHLVPLLDHHLISRQLLPRLVNMLVDGSRAEVRQMALNTVLNIIGNHSERRVKKQLLLTVISKVLKDEHSPIRSAAIDSLVKLQDNFDQVDAATKLLPPLCHLTVDSDSEVKGSAIRAMRALLDKIEKSEKPEPKEKTADSPKRTMSWTEWAKTKISSKITSIFLEDDEPKSANNENNEEESNVLLDEAQTNDVDDRDVSKEGATRKREVTTTLIRLNEDGLKIVTTDENLGEAVTEGDHPNKLTNNNKQVETDENNKTSRKAKKTKGPTKLGTRINQRK